MDHTNKKIKTSSPKGLHCIISYNYLASFGYCYLKSNVFCASCMFFSVSCSNFKINIAISGAAAPYFSKVIQLSTHKSWVTPLLVFSQIIYRSCNRVNPIIEKSRSDSWNEKFPMKNWWKNARKFEGDDIRSSRWILIQRL